MIISDLVVIVDWIRALLMNTNEHKYKYTFVYKEWIIFVYYYSGFEYKIYPAANLTNDSQFVYRISELNGGDVLIVYVGDNVAYRINNYGTLRQQYQYLEKPCSLMTEETFCSLIPAEFMKICRYIMLSPCMLILKNKV